MPEKLYVKHYFGNSSDNPQEVENGAIRYEADTQALYVDQNNVRIRYNPPANWNETNANDPAYIENKPTLGTAASHDITETLNNTTDIPTSATVKTALDSANTWKSQGVVNNYLSKDANGDLAWTNITAPVKSDWNEADSTSLAYIQNKPTLGTVASHDVASALGDTSDIPTASQVNTAISNALDSSVSYSGTQTKSDAEKLQARSNIGAAASSDLQITNQNLSTLSLDFTNAEAWKSLGEEGNFLSKDAQGGLTWVSLSQRFTNIDNYLNSLNTRVNKLFTREDDTAIWLENVGGSIDVPTLLSSATTGTNVRITGLEMDVESADEIDEFYDVLDTLHGLDASGGAVQTAQIYGTISIENISYADKDALSVRYPNITIDNEHYQSFKYFYSEDGTSLVGQMEYIDGVTQDSVPSYPAKQSTEQYSYTAIGWSESPNSSVADADVSESITQDKNYYVVYRADIRSYTIKFARGPKDGNNVIQTSTVQYGETPSYTGETPTTTHGSTTDFTFIGWSPQIEAVHGDATYYAIFQDNRPVTVKYLIKDMDSYTSDVETIGAYAFQNHTALETVETSATDIGQYAFSGCTNLKVVDLTNQD